MDCIFCTVIKDKNNVIYESEKCAVIFDKFPQSFGHMLVIPKIHASYLHELEDDVLTDAMTTIKKIVKAVGFTSYNILQNNKHIQSVFHVHFHIVPCVQSPENCLKINWVSVEIDQKAKSDVYDKIRADLKKI